jgi:hypothetical protein
MGNFKNGHLDDDVVGQPVAVVVDLLTLHLAGCNLKSIELVLPRFILLSCWAILGANNITVGNTMFGMCKSTKYPS